MNYCRHTSNRQSNECQQFDLLQPPQSVFAKSRPLNILHILLKYKGLHCEYQFKNANGMGIAICFVGIPFGIHG
jgi:hypothetical protein